MARKKAQPIVTEYQTRSLLDLAELFYSDPANVKRLEEWQKKQEGKPMRRSQKKSPARWTRCTMRRRLQ